MEVCLRRNGIHIDGPTSTRLIHHMCHILQREDIVSDKLIWKQMFPSALPANLTNSKLDHIHKHQKNWLVSRKVDGLRMICCLSHNGLFLIDRLSMCYFFSTSVIIDTIDQERLREQVYNIHTILDGEYVSPHHDTTDISIFLAFDVLYLHGTDTMKKPYTERYGILSTEKLHPFTGCTVMVYPKRMYTMDEFLCTDTNVTFDSEKEHLHNVIISTDPLSKMDINVDGLVFMPPGYNICAPVSMDSLALKWKPRPTIDVMIDYELLRHELDGLVVQTESFYWTGTRPRRMTSHGLVTLTSDQVCTILSRKTHHSIQKRTLVCVECFFCYKSTQWIVCRIRWDKRFANAERTIIDTIHIIEENIDPFCTPNQRHSKKRKTSCSMGPLQQHMSKPNACRNLVEVVYRWKKHKTPSRHCVVFVCQNNMDNTIDISLPNIKGNTTLPPRYTRMTNIMGKTSCVTGDTEWEISMYIGTLDRTRHQRQQMGKVLDDTYLTYIHTNTNGTQEMYIELLYSIQWLHVPCQTIVNNMFRALVVDILGYEWTSIHLKQHGTFYEKIPKTDVL